MICGTSAVLAQKTNTSDSETAVNITAKRLSIAIS